MGTRGWCVGGGVVVAVVVVVVACGRGRVVVVLVRGERGVGWWGRGQCEMVVVCGWW